MAVPFLISLIVVQGNVFADTFWTSNLGVSAVSGMTSAVPMYMMITAIGLGLSTGIVTTIAFRLGKQDMDAAGRLAGNSIFLAIVISAVMSVLIFLSQDLIIDLMGAQDVSTEIHQYMLPFILLSPITVMNVVFGGMLRAEGAAGRSTLVQMSSVAINIVLDPILIFGLGMGVTGASLATVLSALFGVILSSMWYIRGKTTVRVSLNDVSPNKDVMRELMGVGGPRMVEGFVNNFVILIQRVFIIMASGTVGVSLFNVPFRYVSLGIVPVEAAGMASTPVIAANFGKEDYQKMKDARRYVLKLAVMVGLILMVVVFIAAPLLIDLFTLEPSMYDWYDEFVWNMRVYSVIIPMFAVQSICASVLQAIKKAKYPMRITMIVGAFRMLVFWLASPFGYQGITVALVLSYVLSSTLMYLVSDRCFRKACAA